MSERVRSLVFAALVIAMAVALTVVIATNPSDVDRVTAIGERIKCPVCQGESIANSPSPMARDMIALVTERVEDGQSDQEIIDELLASYSGAVLLDPPVSGVTLLLWFAPVAALVIGAVVIWYWRTRSPSPVPGESPDPETRPRRVVPLLVLGVAFAGTVAAAVLFVQDGTAPASGVAALGDQDLEDVSNETLEAVVAANAEHPEIDGMRLALAERYFEAGEFSAAFPHYLAVAESGNADQSQVVTALIRLGTMAWEGNGEVETAMGLFDQALAVDPGSTTARYLKGQLLWCGAGELEAAEALFAELAADPDLGDEPRAIVEDDLASVRAGESCV